MSVSVGAATADEVTIYFSRDPASWPKIDETLRSYWVQKGPSSCQNRDCDFNGSARSYEEGSKTKIRTLQKSLFKRRLQNGETVDREWLLYSPSEGHVYYFVCRLFASEVSPFSLGGFNDWKHAATRVAEHEHSTRHMKCLLTYHSRKKETGCIDTELLSQLHDEQNYWEEVLKRVVAVVKLLASRGLAFRGDNQTIGSPRNGNYLGILELFGQFDPFIAKYISTHANKGKGTTSYLSASTCEEFIELMSEKVDMYIVAELREAKYYSLSVDSTPDITHTDQLTFIVRYLNNSGPIERFLEFISIHEHGAEYMADVIVNFLRDNHISLADCRGQSYDNASNMAGRYAGLQAKIRDQNKFAEFVPCAGHSLNLVGVKAAECNSHMTSYFSYLQRLYTFYSASPYRWQNLVSVLGPEHKVMKAPSTTRWSARADAVKAFSKGYNQVRIALDALSNNERQSSETRHEAKCICKKMDKIEIAFLTVVWNDLLTRIHETNLTLQKEDMNLSLAVILIKSLEAYIQDCRDKFAADLDKAMVLVMRDSNSNQRIRQRSVRLTRFEGQAEHVALDENQKLKIEMFLPIIDSIIHNLTVRRKAYDRFNDNFGFFLTPRTMNIDQIADHCESLAHFYHEDRNKESLIAECVQLKHYLHQIGDLEGAISMSDLYRQIKTDGLETLFPNVEISLRIFLCMMVTNCSGERSFSKLKLIKNEIRNTMTQKRLNNLSLLSIESDLVDIIDFKNLITDFAAKKCRRKARNRIIGGPRRFPGPGPPHS
ncbi:zinc finger MYM-type protein 1-like [Diprion similis]|uniref:zinc finger MYM-type protein 1-like n=1 Tax=Diprion similis TaxID=362088 RepID=UPI001EF90203|nr:zinc finger MYM-type protein 1-like [Diprion similis]